MAQPGAVIARACGIVRLGRRLLTVSSTCAARSAGARHEASGNRRPASLTERIGWTGLPVRVGSFQTGPGTGDDSKRRMRADVVIRTPDHRLRVFVSSTVGEAGELAAERRAVSRAISALRLTPVLFELGGAAVPAAGAVPGLPGPE